MKRWRKTSLVVFIAGTVAFIAALQAGHHTAFLASGLVAFGGLGLFAFTEAFLFTSPERASFDVWFARVFFVLIAVAVCGLALQLVESLL